MNAKTALCVLLVLAAREAAAQPKWWMEEPVRLIQTNLRETDTGLDPARLAKQLQEFQANVLLFGMGGIVAHYPTDMPFHYRSSHLPAGRDTFGEMLREAHARGIRVIGRFDLSKTQKPVYDAHPEWFFRSVDGAPSVYNGLYSVCINGGYYRGHAMKILSEALERYAVDGLFFNMFGNPASDYSGNPLGPCHCDNCRQRFRARYGRELPANADAQYREFMHISSREVAAEIARLIRDKRPRAAFLTYIQEHVDGIMSESNTSVTRPLPLWLYSASDHVNRARTSEPGKMAFNLSMSFVDYAWRFAAVPPDEIRSRLYQNIAHGGALAQHMHGTLDDQLDATFLSAARPVYAWHARHQELYAGQTNAARVLLLGGRTNAYRGLFRLLSEQHIPFAVSDNLNWLTEPGLPYDLVLSADGAPAALDAYLRRGGRLLVCGTTPPQLDLPKPVRRWQDIRAYLRIHDPKLAPALPETRVLFLHGDYVEYPPVERPLLTLIPPSMFGPPEYVFKDKVETDKPGLLVRDYGQGRMAYLPWDIGGLYYRHSSHAHAGLLTGLIDTLLPGGRQLKTDAHPLVEITVMRQPARNRTLVHLINLTGQSGTAWFPAIPTGAIRLELASAFRSARSTALNRSMPVRRQGTYGAITLPSLDRYDVLVLE